MKPLIGKWLGRTSQGPEINCSGSRGHRFESQLGQTLGSQCFLSKSHLNHKYINRYTQTRSPETTFSCQAAHSKYKHSWHQVSAATEESHQ